MHIPYIKLPSELNNKPMHRLYFIAGNEIFLVQETYSQIKQAAIKMGFTERVIVNTDNNNWPNNLYANLHSLSLLAPKRLIELNLTNIKLATKHLKELTYCINNLPNDIVFLIQTKKPANNNALALQQLCNKMGNVILVPTIENHQLPNWIQKRASQMKITLSEKDANLLAEYTEGNLLATAQELAKLELWQTKAYSQNATNNNLLKPKFNNLTTDNSNYTNLHLSHAIKAKNPQKAYKILSKLLLSGTDHTFLLWIITHEIRQLKSAKIRTTLLHFASHIDQLIKGLIKGNIQDAIEALLLATINGSIPHFSLD